MLSALGIISLLRFTGGKSEDVLECEEEEEERVERTQQVAVKSKPQQETQQTAQEQEVPGLPDEFIHISFNSIWQQKMKAFFRTLDVTKDGFLSADDFETIAERLVIASKVQDAEADVVRAAVMDIWRSFAMVKSREQTAVDEDTFIRIIRQNLEADFETMVGFFIMQWSTIFKAADVNDDGVISRAEYVNLMQAWNVGKAHASAMFLVIDDNGDGEINAEEFVNTFFEYFITEAYDCQFNSLFCNFEQFL